MSKKGVLRIFLRVWPSPLHFPSFFVVNVEMFGNNITFFRSITMLCGTGTILWNILTFGLNVENILHSTDSPQNTFMSLNNVMNRENSGFQILKWSFYAMVPWHLQRENLFCLSHRNTHWTMTMDNIGLNIGLLESSSSMVTLTSFL